MTKQTDSCAFIGPSEDRANAFRLKGMFNGRNTFVPDFDFTLLTQLEIYCASPKRNITSVACTNTDLLQRLLELEGNTTSSAKLSNYAGSVFEYKGIEIVFLNPLRQLFTVPYGKFIAEKFISKVAAPDFWAEPSRFHWSLLTASNINDAYAFLASSLAIATDIETFKHNLAIRCIGYTGVFIDSLGFVKTKSFVLPMDSEWALAWMRKINCLDVPKIFQKGKYDNSYLLRYNAEPTAYFWDTANLFHCWYSELPKDLAFLNAFFLRKVVYWKDLAETNDLSEYYRYNALDTWATANVWIQEILQLPDWAKRNYILEFPLVFPCLLAGMTGIKRDHEKHVEVRTKVDAQIETELKSLRDCLGQSNFNPNSPVQVKQLLAILGCKDITTTEETDLKKAALRHPLNSFLTGKILTIRGLRKLTSTYLRLDSDANSKNGYNGSKEFKNRFLYALDPDGTDTARLASKEHPFWCGGNMQNIPRGEPGEPSYTKETLCADDGFFLAEADLEQAESRDSGHISGDKGLIAAVSGINDFHAHNASAFFGTPYELIFDNETRKTLNKKLRDLSKRTNHGATYNMGILVLIDTMGIDKIWEAGKLLNLPYRSLEEISEHLLTVFHLTYSGLRGPIKIRNESVRIYLRLPKSENKLFAPGTYYAAIAREVDTTRKIVSRAFHHTEYNDRNYKADEYIEQGDWTRYCFGKPSENKLDLNSLIAHPPQSLNARTLNEAFMKVFYDIALVHCIDFRLHAQIHDSIPFSYREGKEHLAERVKECMEIPVTVRDVHGITRTFTVPAALKMGKKDKPSKYWSETE